MIGLGPVKEYQDKLYRDENIIGYQPNGNYTRGLALAATGNSPNCTHFSNANEYELDMLLDFEMKSWSICMVGHNDENRTKKFTNLSLSDEGLVPLFNLYQLDTALRLAKIPPALFGVKQEGIFGAVWINVDTKRID